MLRSGQMLICNGLLEHCLGRRWRIDARLPPHDSGKHDSVVTAVNRSFPDAEVARSVLKLFLDHPECPFGVHNITSTGAQYGIRPGDWFAPTPISQVIRDLCMRYQPAQLRAYCARDGAIYTNELAEMMATQPVVSSVNPTETACIAMSRSTSQTPQAAVDSDNAFIVMIPVRFGINRITEAYFPKITALFHVPEFLGIVGGRPHSSLFFFASQGNHLYYLNPHYVQATVPFPKTTVSLPIHSFVPSRVKKVPVSQLDPSMSLGFLFRSMANFQDFQRRFAHDDDINDLFSIIEGSPDTSPLSATTNSDCCTSRIVDI